MSLSEQSTLADVGGRGGRGLHTSLGGNFNLLVGLRIDNGQSAPPLLCRLGRRGSVLLGWGAGRSLRVLLCWPGIWQDAGRIGSLEAPGLVHLASVGLLGVSPVVRGVHARLEPQVALGHPIGCRVDVAGVKTLVHPMWCPLHLGKEPGLHLRGSVHGGVAPKVGH